MSGKLDEREKRLGEKIGYEISDGYVRWLDAATNKRVKRWASATEERLWRECLRLMAQQEWVKVTPETMPPERVDLWILRKDAQRPCAGLFTKDRGFYQYGWARVTDVTHWREIGVLPTEGGKE